MEVRPGLGKVGFCSSGLRSHWGPMQEFFNGENLCQLLVGGPIMGGGLGDDKAGEQ